MGLRQKPGEDAENPAYIFAEPRVAYWMAVWKEREGSAVISRGRNSRPE